MRDEGEARTAGEKLPDNQAKDSSADEAVEREMGRKTRRSFLVGAGAALAAVGGWHWLGTRREEDGIPWPLRRAHEINEELTRDYFNSSRLAPTFPRSMAQELRINGMEGMDDDFDPKSWKLTVTGLADTAESTSTQGGDSTTSTAKDSAKSKTSGNQDNASDGEGDDSGDADTADDSGSAQAQPLMLTLQEIKKLPRVEMVTEHKCIEGWSMIVHWAGARFADFAAKYPPSTQSGDAPDVLRKPGDLVRYVSIETPGGGYYVGLEMESALHPQTLLCYEMNGEALTSEHGAPLRLVTPIKYGIKSIKRIGKISFTDKRPADYWAEQGYDWYSGH